MKFQYSNNTLILDNVTGDVVIKFGKEKLYLFIADKSKGLDSNIDYSNADFTMQGGGYMEDEIYDSEKVKNASSVYEVATSQDSQYPIYFYR